MSTTYIFNERLDKQIDKRQFKERLARILQKTGIDKSERIAQDFSDKVYKKIEILSKQTNFIAELIKGNTHREIIDIDTFFKEKNISINQTQKKEIHNLIQLALANELNEYMMFQYITQNSPIMSFIKRELLNIRPGTDVLQWKFITEKCFVKEHTKQEIKADFSKIVNYKQISDKLCVRLFSALVKSMTDHRIDNIISQKGKGVYPEGLEELPEKSYKFSPDYLFRIAYSFKMNLKKYDEMLIRNEDIYDCFCYEENMFRFLLTYIRAIDEFDEFMEIIKEKRKYFQEFRHEQYTSEYVNKTINNFFCNKRGTIEELYPDFIELLKKLGVVSAEIRETELNIKRKEIARQSMSQLLKATNYRNIIDYCMLLQNTSEGIIRFRYGNDQENAEKAIKVLRNNYTQLFETTTPEEKTKILSMLCDRFAPKSSSYIIPPIREILKYRFTTEHIGKISTGKTTQPISRIDILKIGYLQTLINFLNENNSHFRNEREMTEAIKKLTGIFEERTNKMLKECCFAPVHTTFPLDGLICIALSNGVHDKSIPEVFQACLPIDITRRITDV